jgi:hypothetical protein
MKKLSILILLLCGSAQADWLFLNDFEGSATSQIGDTTTPTRVNSAGNDNCPTYAAGARQPFTIGTPATKVTANGNGANPLFPNTNCSRSGVRIQGETTIDPFPDPACSGQQSYWFSQNAFDNANNGRGRSELYGSVDFPEGVGGGGNVAFDKEYWVGFSVYHPAGLYGIAAGGWQDAFMGWHGAGSSLNSVPLSIRVRHKNGAYELYTKVSQCTNTSLNAVDCAATSSVSNTFYTGGPILFDQWQHFLVRVRFSADNTGYVKIWQDGDAFNSPSINTGNRVTAMVSDQGPDWKYGMYHAKWRDATRAQADIDNGELTEIRRYMDGIVYADRTGIHSGFTDEQMYDAMVAKAFPNWACHNTVVSSSGLSPPEKLSIQ